MTIALWSQLIIAATLLLGVCAFARRKAPVSAPAGAGQVRTATILRLAA